MIDTIGTDHSPAPESLKQLESGNLARAWGGIASLQVALPAVWTEAKRRGISITSVAEWMAARPAELLGFAASKGEIAAGRDADLVIFDPEASFTVRATALHDRHRLTPYEGRELMGRVEATYLRGGLVFRSGSFGSRVRGKTLMGQGGHGG